MCRMHWKRHAIQWAVDTTPDLAAPVQLGDGQCMPETWGHILGKTANTSLQASRRSGGTLISISRAISPALASKAGNGRLCRSARRSNHSDHSASTSSFFLAFSGMELQTSSLRTVCPKSSTAESIMQRARLWDRHRDKTICCCPCARSKPIEQ